LVEGRIISISDIGYVLGTAPKKIHRWYKEILSGFEQSKLQGKLNEHDIKPSPLKDSIRVPIVLMNNYGPNLAIDEKHIRGRYHTVLSNLDTSKIILLIRSTKSHEVYRVISKYFTSDQMFQVKNITKDGAESYDWVARQAFPNATKVLDKFHVLKWVFDALQNLRIEMKNKYIIDVNEAQIQLNHQYKHDLKIAKSNGIKISKKDYQYKEPIHANEETTRQVISRSKYLLYKYSNDWNQEQQRRAKILFELYPQLQKAYVLTLTFRAWYSNEDIGVCRNLKQQKLNIWLDELSQIASNSFRAMKSTISKHSGQILNYFIEGKSNASAEALNRNIKRFISINYGIRYLDYFYFRLNILHSSTSN
jgi:transposase